MKEKDRLKTLLPKIRKVIPQTLAEDIVGVQPMANPKLSDEEREEIDKERVEAFDKWNWETGADEDRKKFEELDEKLKMDGINIFTMKYTYDDDDE